MIRPSDPQKPRFRPFDGKYAKDRVGRPQKDWTMAWVGLGSVLFFGSFTSPEEALAWGAAVTAFWAVIRTKWDRRKDRRFWALLAALAALHVVVLFLVPVPAPRFGMAVFPFLAADAVVVLALVNWVERRFWAAGGGGAAGARPRAGGPDGVPPHTS